MFDFEKLTVYQKARLARKSVFSILSAKKSIDRVIYDQLRRAVLSVLLNIAEGTGKFTKADRKNFFSIARGSIYETIAVTDVLFDDQVVTEEEHKLIYQSYEEVSKMLLGLINSLWNDNAGVGKSIAQHFWDIGIRKIADLRGKDPGKLYCRKSVLRN